MKQQNFLFVEIVSSIFLLILLIGNFLGLLYITDGNIVISMLSSMFLVVCYFFAILFLKKNKEQMMKHKFLHSSLLFWFFFIILGAASFFLMSHFITIEYQCKQQVQNEAKQKQTVQKAHFIQKQTVFYRHFNQTQKISHINQSR